MHNPNAGEIERVEGVDYFGVEYLRAGIHQAPTLPIEVLWRNVDTILPLAACASVISRFAVQVFPDLSVGLLSVENQGRQRCGGTST